MVFKNPMPFPLNYLDIEDVTQIWVRSGDSYWVYDPGRRIESHDPMDRVGGPYRISDFIDDDTEEWFLFSVADCAFPITDLVRASSFEEAYYAYIDWAAEHRHIKIEDEDLDDYRDEDGDLECDFTSEGVPVCTDNIQGREVKLARIVTKEDL